MSPEEYEFSLLSAEWADREFGIGWQTMVTPTESLSYVSEDDLPLGSEEDDWNEEGILLNEWLESLTY